MEAKTATELGLIKLLSSIPRNTASVSGKGLKGCIDVFQRGDADDPRAHAEIGAMLELLARGPEPAFAELLRIMGSEATAESAKAILPVWSALGSCFEAWRNGTATEESVESAIQEAALLALYRSGTETVNCPTILYTTLRATASRQRQSDRDVDEGLTLAIAEAKGPALEYKPSGGVGSFAAYATDRLAFMRKDERLCESVRTKQAPRPVDFIEAVAHSGSRSPWGAYSGGNENEDEGGGDDNRNDPGPGTHAVRRPESEEMLPLPCARTLRRLAKSKSVDINDAASLQEYLYRARLKQRGLSDEGVTERELLRAAGRFGNASPMRRALKAFKADGGTPSIVDEESNRRWYSRGDIATIFEWYRGCFRLTDQQVASIIADPWA